MDHNTTSQKSIVSAYLYNVSSEEDSLSDPLCDLGFRTNHHERYNPLLNSYVFWDKYSKSKGIPSFSSKYSLEQIQLAYQFKHETLTDVEYALEQGSIRTKNLPISSSTSSSDINRSNEAYFRLLKANTETFAQSLKYSDFEDGVVSEIAQQVATYIEENRFVTYTWLNYVYSQYIDNPTILAALLRVIGQLDINEEVDCLLPIVVSGLNHKNSATQEAAIMVIENWRTINCLKALEETNFSSDWMASYAKQVINELKEELV